MRSQNSNVLLIDVDGTLVDSFPGIRESFLYSLDQVGWPRPDEERVSQIAGPPMELTLASLGMSPEQAHETLGIYLEHFGQVGWDISSMFPGVDRALDRWREEGFLLCTATSKGEGFARSTLQKFGLLDKFDFLGAAEERGQRRSKKAVIQYVLDSMDLHGREDQMLLIGDRIHDVDGARAFGIETCLVGWGYGSSDERDQADHVARDINDLERIVDDWAN